MKQVFNYGIYFLEEKLKNNKQLENFFNKHIKDYTYFFENQDEEYIKNLMYALILKPIFNQNNSDEYENSDISENYLNNYFKKKNKFGDLFSSYNSKSSKNFALYTLFAMVYENYSEFLDIITKSNEKVINENKEIHKKLIESYKKSNINKDFATLPVTVSLSDFKINNEYINVNIEKENKDKLTKELSEILSISIRVNDYVIVKSKRETYFQKPRVLYHYFPNGLLNNDYSISIESNNNTYSKQFNNVESLKYDPEYNNSMAATYIPQKDIFGNFTNSIPFIAYTIENHLSYHEYKLHKMPFSASSKFDMRQLDILDNCYHLIHLGELSTIYEKKYFKYLNAKEMKAYFSKLSKIYKTEVSIDYDSLKTNDDIETTFIFYSNSKNTSKNDNMYIVEYSSFNPSLLYNYIDLKIEEYVAIDFIKNNKSKVETSNGFDILIYAENFEFSKDIKNTLDAQITDYSENIEYISTLTGKNKYKAIVRNDCLPDLVKANYMNLYKKYKDLADKNKYTNKNSISHILNLFIYEEDKDDENLIKVIGLNERYIKNLFNFNNNIKIELTANNINEAYFILKEYIKKIDKEFFIGINRADIQADEFTKRLKTYRTEEAISILEKRVSSKKIPQFNDTPTNVLNVLELFNQFSLSLLENIQIELEKNKIVMNLFEISVILNKMLVYVEGSGKNKALSTHINKSNLEKNKMDHFLQSIIKMNNLFGIKGIIDKIGVSKAPELFQNPNIKF